MFGILSKEELSTTVYEKDISAGAVILFDVGESTLTGGKSVFKRHSRIKILNESGLRYADVVVPFFSIGNAYWGRMGSFNSLKASTYNLVNGKVEETKLESKGKFKEEFVDGIHAVRFALPQVRIGSVIEYQYEIITNYFFILPDWEFQHLIPCKWSEYETHITQAATYQMHFQGYLPLAINEQKSAYCGGITATEAAGLGMTMANLQTVNAELSPCKYYRWAMADIPAFKEEPFITSYKNYTSKIKFDLASVDMPYSPPRIFLTSWDDVRLRYLEEVFGFDNVKDTRFLQKITERLISGIEQPDDKLWAIYNYVKSNLEWAGYYAPKMTKEPKKIFEEGKGSSADINLILLAMLRYAGMPADPVLISTRENGFVRQEVPVRSQFNSVLVMSKFREKKLLLDATDRLLPINFLPRSCLNGYGYHVKANGYEWVDLTGPRSRTSINVDLSLDENGDMKGKFTAIRNGYDARGIREKISKEGLEKHLDEIFKGKIVHVQDTVVENLENLNEPVKENYACTLSGLGQKTGDTFSLDPMLFLKQTANPFVLEQRTYPVDFSHPQETSYMLKLKIPNGYIADASPQSKLSLLPDNAGKFTYSVSVSDENLTIMSQVIINQQMFGQEEYLTLKEFYNIIVAKQNELLVLKRKPQ